jgi:hypothetical protein
VAIESGTSKRKEILTSLQRNRRELVTRKREKKLALARTRERFAGKQRNKTEIDPVCNEIDQKYALASSKREPEEQLDSETKGKRNKPLAKCDWKKKLTVGDRSARKFDGGDN